MLPSIHLTNLWVFYVLIYVIAFPLRQLANRRRGEPIEDPEMLMQHKLLSGITVLWLFGGLAISLFVPLRSGILFYIGLVFYVVGLAIVAAALVALGESGLVRGGVYRYSRNPNYVGMVFVIFGLMLMGWSASLGSVLFTLYFLLTIPYFHWTVLTEEAFLSAKFGDSYRDYLSRTARYFGTSDRTGV
jgi:protein-S-isoprenylcysteine O-methyltransferase Ste14